MCRKTVLLPGFFGESGGAGARGTAERARQRAQRTSVQARLPFLEKPGRLVIVMAVMLVAGVLLLKRVKLGPPSTDRRRARLAQDNLAVLRAALDQFDKDCGRHPSPREGLVSLIHDPGLEGWRGPYIFELKPDPWGNAYQYEREGDLRSGGPDGIAGSPDDIRLEWPGGRAPPSREAVFPAKLQAP